MTITEKQAAHTSESGIRNSSEIDTVRQEAALGHKQELSRHFGLWSVTSLGIVIAKWVLQRKSGSRMSMTRTDLYDLILALGPPLEVRS